MGQWPIWPIGPTGETWQTGPIGPTGIQGVKGEDGEVTLSKLKASTFTCDGQFCTFPSSKRGIDWGYGSSKILDDGQLRVLSDDNIILNVDGNKGLYINNNGSVGDIVMGNEYKPDFVGVNIKRQDGSYTQFDTKDGKNYIRGNTVMDAGGLQYKNGYGSGPYKIRFYEKNRCLDSGQFARNGDNECSQNNSWQDFYFDPVTGYIRNVQNNKCLDTFSGKLDWNTCSTHPNQRFWRMENLIRSRNGNCLDISNSNHNSSCNGDSSTQRLVFD